MCGIVSIFAYHEAAPQVDREELLRMRERMADRGPDGAGEWYSTDKRVGLGHRRLAIIDLSENGAQPMRSHDSGHVITFNGEIYNYRELRAGLEKKGHRFRTASDTEVLLALYAHKGQDMVHDLRGMYAFAIWDERKKGMFLARDPFGIKPLYYADDGKMFRTASQVKALLAGEGVDLSPEPAGHVGFFLWGHVPEPYTMYKNIRSLPAGTTLWVDRDGNKRLRRFHDINDDLATACWHLPVNDQLGQREQLRSALIDTVRHHLVSDVSVGVFLSSGIDSTTLTALASEMGVRELHTVSLGFHEYRQTENDETPLAELMAREYGTAHRTIWVSKKDFQADFPRLLDAMDQPSTDGVNSYFVSKAAKQAGLKVALSGLGGDELFGSYPSFKQVPRSAGMLRFSRIIPGLGKAFRVASEPLLKRFTSPKYAGLIEYGGTYGGAYLLRRGMFMPWELPELLDGELVREGWRELQTLLRLERTEEGIPSRRLKVMALEMNWYLRNQLLRDTDWASMAHSLEIRVPLVDRDLLRTVAPLTCGRHPPTKRDMASTPARSLPAEILDRRKTGFTVPVRDWFSGDAAEKGERGLRGWAKRIYASFGGAEQFSAGSGKRFFVSEAGSGTEQQSDRRLRFLALVTDAYGGHGGIATYNRDLLTALCEHPDCVEVVALPRLMPNRSETRPANLTYATGGLGGKMRYVAAVWKIVRSDPDFDLIICGHINLIPLAMLLRAQLNVPVLLEVFGIDAWQPTASLLANMLVRKIDAFISISDITRQRFCTWSKVPQKKGFLVPNAIHLDRYGAGPKNQELLRRYGLEGKTVLMTMGRLVSRERYKGFDEVLDLLPELSGKIPNIAYMIVGGGDDLLRLREKTRALGIADRVVFTGSIPEEEKADHYRLADAYVMPSRGEGFGFVFLEAMACGIPVVGSTIDGSREALLNGELGFIVDPGRPDEVMSGIIAALQRTREVIPPKLEYYTFVRFVQRAHDVLERAMRENRNSSAVEPLQS